MVKIAQIGAVCWGRNLVRNFHNIGALAAIVKSDSAVGSEQSKLYNVPICTLDEVLNNPEIDEVSIATTAETHAEIALNAIAYSKHVFVEKPLALKIASAEKVIAEGRANNRIVMVGHLLQITRYSNR